MEGKLLPVNAFSLDIYKEIEYGKPLIFNNILI